MGAGVRPARVLVEALRLDRDPADVVRRQGRAAVELGVGGFVLFGGDAGEVGSLTGELQARAGRRLWFGADLERGAGQQFRGAEELPPPAALASHPDPDEAARTAARVTATQARSLGVNWLLAPVLDLDVEPENPIVGTRSFGGTPERVAALGRSWIEACQGAGAAACMKHFPGHGRTLADSHAELPVVDADREVLQADLRPFQAAAPVVATAMVAHVAYPDLAGGSRRPATLEPSLVRRLLREELGFRGPAATDAMNMAGFAEGGEEPEGGRAPAALRAGCDLLLYPDDLRTAAAELVRASARSGEVRGRIEEAVRRSEEALARLPDPSRGPPHGTALDLPSPVELDRLAERCVVSVGPSPAALLPPGRALAVRVLDDDAGQPSGGAGGDGAAFGQAFRKALTAAEIPVSEAGEGGAPRPTVLLVRSTPRAWKGRASLGEEARRAVGTVLGAEAPVYPVVFGHRRVLEELDRPGACAWWGRPRAERAAARWIARRLQDEAPAG